MKPIRNQKKKELVKVPKDFQYALAKNFCAMKYFSEQSTKKQQQIISKAQTMTTHSEIESYVTELGNII